MASPQTRNLKTANGGKVAPQHYNDAMGDFEYSKGSDGALHTKVINQPNVTLVDKNGNPIDSGNKLPVDVTFPAEQAVKDTDVLAKLADIETKIQATNDRLNQTLNTQLTGSSVPDSQPLPSKNIGKFIQTTIINAQSVAAGSSTGYIDIGVDGTESEVWVAVNVDQQPWGIVASSFWKNNGSSSIYPNYWNKATAYPILSIPAVGLLLGIQWESQGGTAPNNFTLAKDCKMPIPPGTMVNVYNQSTSNATVTVRIIRIWR